MTQPTEITQFIFGQPLSEEALDRARKQLPDATVVTVPTDVSRLEDVQRLKDRAYDAFGEVAVLMNNAGISAGGGPFDHYICDTCDASFIIHRIDPSARARTRTHA
jgi:NAD(P)-dependent dehydrogenase (short-subunit alcohol dehydrogenase family)